MSCTHYGKPGHEQSNCCEIVGYPAGWGTRGRGRGQGGHGTHGGISSVGGAIGEIAHAIAAKTRSSSTIAEAT